MDAEAEAQRGRLTCLRSHSTLTAESDTGIQPAGPLTSGLSLSYMSPLLCFGFSLHLSPSGVSSFHQKTYSEKPKYEL